MSEPARALLYVFFAGGLGSAARYLAGRALSGAFPWGTLTVNLVGALCIGVVAELAQSRGLPRGVTLTLATGFLGGFTTFSALALETTQLFASRPLMGAAYALGTLGAGVALALVGAGVARAAL